MLLRFFTAVLVGALIGGCSGTPTGSYAVPQQRRDGEHRLTRSNPISHVVVIVQENRSFDNLFQFFPGADTQSWGNGLHGIKVPLQSALLTAPWGILHSHPMFVADYNGGAMNGWQSEACIVGSCPSNAAYAYVPQNEVQPYYDLASQYVIADHMFQTNQGPSFPAHQYLLSGTSTVSDGASLRAAENPTGPKDPGGCDSSKSSRVILIDSYGSEAQQQYPCFNRSSLITELDAAGLTWHYYQAKGGPGEWHGVAALQPIYDNPSEYEANVIYPSSRVLTDIAKGTLADVTWITPTALASDHADETNGSGPSWVASIVNAIGQSRFWNSTAIFVVWDDWGGWFDHEQPTIYNSYENGFRVPLLVISPYAKTGYISTVPHEFGSILKFTEETFGLPSLGTTDVRSDDLSDCFNYLAEPRQFEPIAARFPASYFLHDTSGTADD